MASSTRSGSSARLSLRLRFIVISAILAGALFVGMFILTSLNLLLCWILSWTVATFALYGYDKMQAKRQRLRVPEASLFVMAIAGGFLGALGGMLVFRHKTAKPVFWIVNLGSMVAYVILFVLVRR